MMKGRTKLNYGSKGALITMDDINHMFDLINSDLDEDAKAINLYSFCNDSSLKNNIELYNTLGLKEVEKLKELLKIYKEYEEKGYFKIMKNSYRCTLEEIALRVKKINLVFDIINSTDNDYKKVEKLLTLFKGSKEFKRSYALLSKYGKNDARLDLAREALDNFDFLYAKFKEYEDKDIVSNVKYVLSIENYLQVYDYAKFVISAYVNTPSSYKKEFLDELGIDREILAYCASVIEELDVDLYKEYLSKRELNRKENCFKNAATISDLANGINTGVLSDGTKFELLEFIKRVPFKNDNSFGSALASFMKRNNPKDMNTIVSYVNDNKLSLIDAFEPLNLKALYHTRTTINGIEITDEDKTLVLDYLKINGIPIINKSYVLARAKFLNGEITRESVDRQKEQVSNFKKVKPRILVPSIKRNK